jgi:hypothetical protein
MSDQDVIELPEVNVYPDDVPPPPIGSLAAQDGYQDTRMRDALWRMGASAEPERLVRPDAHYATPAPWAANAVRGAAQGAVDYVKRPQQTMTPNPHDPASEEWQFYEDMRARNASDFANETALNAIGTGGIVGVPARASEPVLGSFAGRKSLTADLPKLATAEKMAASGAAPEAIRSSTGWFQLADGKWRYEIPDNAARWKMDPMEIQAQGKLNPDRPIMMGDAFDHPELYAAYPKLKDIELSVAHGGSAKGAYSPGFEAGDASIRLKPAYNESMRSTNLHELTHGVQNIEGFGTGGNAMFLKPGTPGWKIYQERLKAIRTPATKAQLEADGVLGPDYTYEQYLKQHKDSIKKMGPMLDRSAQEYAVQEGYRRMAGEVEARNVQTRADFTPEQRAAKPPWETQDVPTDKQFVKFGMGDIAEARDPRLWSPISNTKLRKPLDEMEHRYTDVRTPVPKFVNPEDLLGGYGIFTPSDLSAANRTVTHIDNTRLDRPVTAHGGVGFPEANPGMAWASERPIARKLDNQAAALTEKSGGKPVYIMPMTMSPSAIDASHHVADPLAQMVKTAKIKRDDVAAFNDLMRAQVPDWVSIKSPKFADYISRLEGGMKVKALMADRMALAEWQKKGFPDVAAVRHAMSEPALIDAPRFTTGMTIARYEPGKGLLETSHPSYSKGVAGHQMGQLASLAPFEDAAPTIAQGLAEVNARNLAAGKKQQISPRFHMEKPTPGVPTAQYFDDQWLENFLKRQAERER